MTRSFFAAKNRKMKVAQFTFNPFAENTFVIWDETNEAIIIDPGMADASEDAMLFDFIKDEGLKPVLVLNTHCHIDHILGNSSTTQKYGIELWAHKNELAMLERAPSASLMWNVPYKESPQPNKFIDEGDKVTFGNTTLDILFVPGHSPGHIVFINHNEKLVIGGDVLFNGSVGRVDLPGSNGQDLVKSIQQKMYALPNDYTVYPGHGPETTIGHEKENNMFVRPDWSGL